MFDGRFRTPIDRAVRPLGAALRRAGISADHLTIIGLVLAVAAAFVLANGWLLAAFFLVLGCALPDLLDGAVAKASNMATSRGAFFDSTADRLTDALLFGGLAWFFASHYGGHMALLPFGVMASSSLISYERAKAESLGFDAKGGLMERAERIILLELGLLVGVPGFLVVISWVMLVLTSVTAVQRFAKVWKQASAQPAIVERRAQVHIRRTTRRAARVDRRLQLRRRRL